MNLIVVLLTVFELTFLPSVHMYNTGAPASACGTMLPDHGASGQTTPSPFSIDLSVTSYTASSTIDVTLKSNCTTKFFGFMIQARRADNGEDRTVPIGSFAAISGTKVVCTGGLTHSSSVARDNVVLTWTAPGTTAKNIVFKVTFVTQIRETFWQAVTSEPATDGTPLNNIATDSQETTVITDPANCPGTQPVPSTTVTPPAFKFAPNPGCGSTVGCYSDCDTTSCSYETTWNFNGANMDITIKMASTQQGAFYGAIGFSKDAKMGSDSVIGCIRNSGGGINVHNSFNTGRSNAENTLPQEGLTTTSTSYTSNILECKFSRVINGASNVAQLFDLSQQHYLFFASGSAGSSGLQKHSTTPTSSPVAIDFSQNVNYAAVAPSKALIKAHGSLMVIGWITAASIGLISARYFKPVWPTRQLLGQKIWFQIHRTCMISTFAATIIAFIIIFVQVGAWTEPDGSLPASSTTQAAHPVLGVIVTALCIANPIMAMFRPHPGTDNRFIFNWAHWAVGSAAYVLAVITVAIGTRMDTFPLETVWVVVGFVVWQLIVVLALELVQYLANKEKKNDSYELNAPGSLQVQTTDTPSKAPGGTLKVAILLVHAVVVVVFTIAVIALIAQ